MVFILGIDDSTYGKRLIWKVKNDRLKKINEIR